MTNKVFILHIESCYNPHQLLVYSWKHQALGVFVCPFHWCLPYSNVSGFGESLLCARGDSDNKNVINDVRVLPSLCCESGSPSATCCLTLTLWTMSKSYSMSRSYYLVSYPVGAARFEIH